MANINMVNQDNTTTAGDVGLIVAVDKANVVGHRTTTGWPSNNLSNPNNLNSLKLRPIIWPFPHSLPTIFLNWTGAIRVSYGFLSVPASLS